MSADTVVAAAVRAVGEAVSPTWWTVTPPAGDWRRWDDVFAPSAAAATLDEHAALLHAPRRLAGTFVASTLVQAFARLQGICRTLLGEEVVVDPATLQVDVTGGRVRRRLGLPEAEVRPAGTADRPSLDTLIERCVGDLSVGGRVSARVIACDAAFAWLGGVRGSLPEARRHEARDLLREQWRGDFSLDELVVEHRVPVPEGSDDRYLSRAVCCLDYHVAPEGGRTYCPSCPLVPAGAIVARRAAVMAGEQPRPFDDRDRDRARHGHGTPATPLPTNPERHDRS